MRFSTRAVHAGLQGAEADVTPPIHLSSIYRFASPEQPLGDYEYIRYGNPTRGALETCLAQLENAPCPALCFSSGMAAIDAAMRLLRAGEEVLIARDVYGGTSVLAERLLAPSGVVVAVEDATRAERFTARIGPQTRMVWIETPSNPLLRLTDIRAVVEAAHASAAVVAIDNTFATPYFQNPLDLGVDIVMHSTTKYLGGHSDLLGGALVTRDAALRERLLEVQRMGGAVAAPFDSWLTLRGIRTLPVRMEAHSRSAERIARALVSHPKVLAVHYPGLESHPGHNLAQRQMRGYGGMLAMDLEGGRPAVEQFVRRLRVFALAPSLGGVESICSYPAAMSHSGLSPDERAARGVTDGLIRLSVGLEDPEDLVEDVLQAL